MKGLSALVLGLGLAFGVAAGAQAAPTPNDYVAEANESGIVDLRAGHPHHHCHGMSAGTADHACGTLTGGPSGGLF